MIEAHELAAGVWLFVGDATGRNFCVVLSGDKALLVDPGSPEPIERFLADMNAHAEGVAYTTNALASEPSSAEAWADLPTFAPASFSARTPLPVSLPGWDAVPFGATSGRTGLLHARERVLVCGDLLPEPAAGIPDLQYGIEAYLESLGIIERLDLKLVVPWRGQPAAGKRAIKQRIEHDRSYVQSVVRHIATSAASGLPLSRLLEVASNLYSDFPHLDAHLANMRYTWDEWKGVTRNS